MDKERNDPIRTAAATGRLGIVGIWLMALYAVTIATAIMAFSAFQFQTLLGAAGQTLSIGELENERKSFLTRQDLHDAARANVETIQASLFQASQDYIAFSETLSIAEAKQQDLLQDAIVLIGSLPGHESYEINRDDNINERLLQAQLIIVALRQELLNQGNSPQIEGMKKIDDFLDAAKKINQEYNAADAKSFYLYSKQQSMKDQLEGARKELTALSNDPFDRPELIGMFQQIAFFERVYFGKDFATMPPALLIPIVTLAMGALGSVIYLSAGVVAGEPVRPMIWYVFRPMLGMVTAFAVFIFVQAGALVVNQPGQDLDPGQLNPYFIAFVSVISGLLSEQAVQRIQGVARNFFRSEEETKTDTTPVRRENNTSQKTEIDEKPSEISGH